MTPSVASKKLVILYGIGGLSDVGRHAILAALEKKELVSKITVITEYPELLNEKQWECGCPGGHTNPFQDTKHASKLEMVQVKDWKTDNQHLLAPHFQGADAVISCLGHRQPGWSQPILRKRGIVAHDGNKQVIQAMQASKVERAVVISSLGVQEDWPPMEFHFAGKILGCMFKSNSKKAFEDLNAMEVAYKDKSAASIDYLFVRPVGISEDCKPCGEWYLQQEKYKDILGLNMAKMDVARFMVQEALTPTFHRRAVAIGAKPPNQS